MVIGVKGTKVESEEIEPLKRVSDELAVRREAGHPLVVRNLRQD